MQEPKLCNEQYPAVCRVYHVGCILWQRLLPQGWTSEDRVAVPVFINTVFDKLSRALASICLLKSLGEYAVPTQEQINAAVSKMKDHLTFLHAVSKVLLIGPLRVRTSDDSSLAACNEDAFICTESPLWHARLRMLLVVSP